MKTIYIYALKDPETLEIRYIGKSVNPKRRLRGHINKSKDRIYHSAQWIKSLLNKNMIPIMEIIEKCNENNWEERITY